MSRTNNQQLALLAALLQGSVTTLQARNELFIMSPAARVMELKEQGHNIITYWTEAGKAKIAKYVLINSEVLS